MLLSYTLVGDGSSDRLLLNHLNWLLREATNFAFRPQWADLRMIPGGPPRSLAGKIRAACDLYPSDLLFVHRDAESEPWDRRSVEVLEALASISNPPPAVCVIPVRMTEAWLLFDEGILRRAAGNPHGCVRLALPPLRRLEELADPKEVLRSLLLEASELSPRRRRSFDFPRARRLVAEYADDFSALRALPAFAALEAELGRLLLASGWA